MAENETARKEGQDIALDLAQKLFLVKTPDAVVADRQQVQQDMLSTVLERNMAPFYRRMCAQLDVPLDSGVLQRMEEVNQQRLKEFDDSIKDAQENAGDIEVRDALRAKAEFLASLTDREAAMTAFEAAEAKTAGAGPRMDLMFGLLRLEMSFGEWNAVKDLLEKAKQVCALGGDWERKNRLRVYEAVFAMANRQFKRAAELFLDAIPTFTATELMSYEQCTSYAIVLAPLALDRPDLKGKVVDSPEILSIIDSIPHARQFIHCLHACQYGEFFKAFSHLCDAVRSDRYLHPHFRYWMKEVRVAAYCQFLEPYRSVALSAMGTAFGVSVEFLDSELSEFIVAGRVPAKIDRVTGVVETNRPDAKNALYQQTIKQGDILLTRLQKLSKVIDVEA